MKVDELGEMVVGSAIAVHRELGPGLLESVYQAVLAEELKSRGLEVACQVPISIHCRGHRIEEAFRADIIVEGKIILELKVTERPNEVHRRQLITYLKLTGVKLGYILNFGQPLMKDGITRVINGFDLDT